PDGTAPNEKSVPIIHEGGAVLQGKAAKKVVKLFIVMASRFRYHLLHLGAKPPQVPPGGPGVVPAGRGSCGLVRAGGGVVQWGNHDRKGGPAMHPEVEAFYNGSSFGCHRLLGARPAGRGWRFTVWAPHARRVQVLGDWNGWDLYTAAELAACEDGLWRGTVPDAPEGQLYKYNLLGRDGVWRMRPDLFARDGEALPGTASRLPLPPAPPPRR